MANPDSKDALMSIVGMTLAMSPFLAITLAVCFCLVKHCLVK